MRYQIRWANGYWNIFDLKFYRPVELFGRKVDAEEVFNRPV